MKIQQKKEGNSLLIKFSDLNDGQLDLTNIKLLRGKFKNILSGDNKNIILDFNTVEYIDSSVIGFIVDTYNEIRNKNGTVKLINIDKNIYETLEMINLVRFLDIERK